MQDTTRREDLVCRPCLMKEMSMGSNICKNGHDPQYIDWKCMYCCSVALFNCHGGTNWFCDRCHSEGGKKLRDCGGKKCPLNVPHPPASKDHKKSAFALGCSLCRSDHLKDFDEAQAAIAAMIGEEKVKFVTSDRMLHKSVKIIPGKKKGKRPPSPKKKALPKAPAKHPAPRL